MRFVSMLLYVCQHIFIRFASILFGSCRGAIYLFFRGYALFMRLVFRNLFADEVFYHFGGDDKAHDGRDKRRAAGGASAF